MPAPHVKARRDEWCAAFDPDAPLADQLPRPHAKPWQIAHVMGVSESTVYDSGRRFDAAYRAGDDAAAAREVPCLILGHSYRFPTDAFVTWWESAGAGLLRRLEAVAS